MIVGSQALAMLAILVLAWLGFRLQPVRYSLKALVMSSLLVVLSVVLSIFSAMIPLFGFPALKIGFSQLPLMLVGVWFGPAFAFMAGLSADVIELLSGTISFPFLGFTLNKILVAMLPALAMHILSRAKLNAQYIALSLLGIVFGLALIYVWTVETVLIGETMVEPLWSQRSGVSVILLGLGLSLSVGLHQLVRHKHFANAWVWILGVLLVEVVVQLILTPIWLRVMFGLPIVLSVSIRLIKATFMVFIHGFLGLSIVRGLSSYLNK